MTRGVVVTGVGLATPLGLGREATWARLCAGESGIRRLRPDLGTGFGCHYAGAIDAPPEEGDTCPSVTHRVALGCAAEALGDAGLDAAARRDLPTFIGNSAVERTLERKRALWESRRLRAAGDRAASCAQRPTQENRGGHALEEFALAAWLRGRLGLGGPVATLASNCVAGLQAIILGALRIVSGRCERVLAGGVDCVVTPEMLARFSLLHALTPSSDPGCSRPFDQAHSGMVLGDGAGFLVLESAAAARRRAARVYARLTGWGMTSDSHHLTRGAPDARSKAAAIRQALATAGLAAERVELVSAHGTGTVDNDETEIRALRLALGEHAERVPITAPKSALGHSLAASGAVESALAMLTLRDGVVAPILNLTHPAEGCDVGGLVRQRLALRPRVILKSAFAFGGFNACVVFQHAAAGAGPVARGRLGACP